MPYGIEQFGALGAGIGQGITGAMDDERQRESDAATRKREAQKLLLEIQDAARKKDESERGIAKERWGIAQTDSQALIRSGQHQAAHERIQVSRPDYNRLIGGTTVGPKLVGTDREIQGPLEPGVVKRPTAYDPETPNFQDPRNKRAIEAEANYAPKTESFELGYGQQRWERTNPADPWQKVAEGGARPAVDRPDKFVMTPGPDGNPVYGVPTAGMPAWVKPEKPGSAEETDGADEAKVWALVDKRLAASKPMPSADKTIDQRTGQPLADAYAAYETARQAAFDKEWSIVLRSRGYRPGGGYGVDRPAGRDPFGAPAGAGNPNRPSAATGGTARWAPIIDKASTTYGVPVAIIQALMGQESGGTASARSPVGAMGLMQLMPGTAKALGVTKPYDPEQNIMAGVKYLRQQYDTFKSWPLAFAAYNGGPGANAFSRDKGHEHQRLWENPNNHTGPNSYGQTYNYVNAITGRLNQPPASPAKKRPAPPHPAFKRTEVSTPASGKKRRLSDPAQAPTSSPFRSSAIDADPAADVSTPAPVQMTEMAGAPPVRPTRPGTIDTTKRPIVKNADGSISTVRSIGVTFDDGTYLLPTVIGNRVVSETEAVAHFRRTGQHLGVFKSPQESNAYAEWLHQEQAQRYAPQAAKAPVLTSPKLSAFYERHGITPGDD